jgi:phage terminase large subunit
MNRNNDINQLLSNVNPLDLKMNLFKQGVFDFIVEGISKDGEVVRHDKQEQALRVLRDNNIEEVLYGGSIGGGKTYLGANWLLFMGLIYPGTKWFIARNELGKLIESSFRTFQEVCRKHNYTDYKFNANKNHITFGNGTMINLIEVKYKPSDPMFETLGSIEYTGGWIEEGGEIHEEGYKKLMERIGRWRNEEYGITRKMLITCNPKRNWMYQRYYKPFKNNTLNKYSVFLEALITDNVFLGRKYIEGVIRNYEGDKVGTERLIKGNWDYEDNPYQLAEQEMIEAIYTNDHVAQNKGKGYITADIAGQGSDKAVIGYWEGWNLVEIITFDTSTAPQLINAIKVLRFKHRVPQHRVVVDADGLGWGVVTSIGGKSFRNNGSPIRVGREIPNYKNLQTQCLYLLADKINEGELYVSADLSTNKMQYINDELAQIQSKGDHDPEKKLECKGKAQIAQDIGRSPDYRDMMLMRIFFDLKKTISLVTNWS